jgi:hypothetical protein
MDTSPVYRSALSVSADRSFSRTRLTRPAVCLDNERTEQQEQIMRRCALVIVVVELFAGGAQAQVKRSPAPAPPSADFQQALKSYEAGNYHSASIALHRVAEGETGDSAATTQRADWWLARALFHLHLYSPAAASFDRLLKDRKHAFHAAALNWLVALDSKLTAAAGLRQKMSQADAALVAPKEFDRTRDEILVLMAQGHAARGDLRAALPLLKRVAATSVVAPRARLVEGLLQGRSGRRAEAMTTLRAALDLVSKAPTRPGVKEVSEQAHLALARLASGAGQAEVSLKAYAQLPATSVHALEVLLLGAWAHVQRKETAKALDRLGRLHTARFSHFYLPEGLVLRAALHLQQGDGDRAEESLKAYRARFPRLRAYVESMTRTYKDPIDLYAHFVQVRGGAVPPEKDEARMIDLVLEEPELQDHLALMRELDRELTLIQGMPFEWKATAIAGVALQDLTLQKSLVQHEIGQRAAKHLLLLAVELRRLEKVAAALEAAVRSCRAARGKPGALAAPKIQLTFTPTPRPLLDLRHPQPDLLAQVSVTILAACGP